MKFKPVLRDAKKLIASIETRTTEGERGIYANPKEVKELRKLFLLLQYRVFGLFASLESDDAE